MPIQIYDTLTARKREFIPVQPGKARVYFCGPTVYDHAHMGHARSYVVWDVVVRHLRARGFEVRYVRNFTDVDDKIIKRAKERGEDPVALASHFANTFSKDMDALGNARPDVEPRVTETIPEIVALIQKLVDRGFAYASGNGDVYYSVRKFTPYLCLSRRHLDDLEAGARVEPDEAKRDPLDFALWKAAKPGEPAWESPWGMGRPGWHIECSAMTEKHLGLPFDIHGGGKDLVFPHHSNEIAQSVAAISDRLEVESFARYWMHNGFLEIDSEKMSKSLGNFFTIREVTAQYDAEVVRLFLLGTHYRNPINYSTTILDETEKRLVYLYETLDRTERLCQGATPKPGGGPMAELVSRANEALDDDFNTAAVLGYLAEAFTAANTLADRKGKKTPEEKGQLEAFIRDTCQVARTLGILQRSPAEALMEIRDRAAIRRGIDRALVTKKLAERSEARRVKDFARADAIRDELQRIGVAIMDSAAGTTWKVE